MVSNYTNPENITRIYEFIQWENEITNSMMGNMIVFAIFIILFIAMKRFPTKSAFAAASFISMIIAVFLRVLGIVHPLVVLATILLTAISGIMLMMDKER